MDNKQRLGADMDNCVPVQQTSDPVNFPISSHRNSVGMKSPIKDHSTVNVDHHSMAEPASKSQSSSPIPQKASFRDLSNREVTFFDSQMWLESDCEDFHSVDGDFAPSFGSTPIFHEASFVEAPQSEKSFYISSAARATPEPSPKQLIELFRESLDKDLDAIDTNQNIKYRKEANKPISFYLPTKWTSRRRETTETTTTPAGCFNTRKEQSKHSVKCCFPSLVENFSFCERKKKLRSPYNNGGL